MACGRLKRTRCSGSDSGNVQLYSPGLSLCAASGADQASGGACSLLRMLIRLAASRVGACCGLFQSRRR
ncbi:hypothetical protein D3C84_1282190 [compost metagenome]